MIENLNDINNLNPAINPCSSPVRLINTPEERKKSLEVWEDIDDVKNNIGAYDKRRQIPIGRTKKDVLEILAWVGALSILLIALIFAYSVYENGSIMPKLFCGNTTVNIPQCPAPANLSVVCNNTCPVQSCNCGSIVCANLTCQTPNIYLNCS